MAPPSPAVHRAVRAVCPPALRCDAAPGQRLLRAAALWTAWSRSALRRARYPARCHVRHRAAPAPAPGHPAGSRHCARQQSAAAARRAARSNCAPLRPPPTAAHHPATPPPRPAWRARPGCHGGRGRKYPAPSWHRNRRHTGRSCAPRARHRASHPGSACAKTRWHARWGPARSSSSARAARRALPSAAPRQRQWCGSMPVPAGSDHPAVDHRTPSTTAARARQPWPRPGSGPRSWCWSRARASCNPDPRRNRQARAATHQDRDAA